MRKRPRKNDDVHNGFGEWGGYMDAKKSKLEEQFVADALKNPYKQSNLFAGISIFVNGLTNPSNEDLKRIMMTHGGVYHTYQKSSTTFIIASNLPDVKVRQITTAKIISPQWIVDCMDANKIVDYSNYLLYTNCKVSQPKISFQKKEIAVASDPTPDPMCDSRANVNKTEECTAENAATSEQPKSLNIMLNLNILNTVIRGTDEQKTVNAAEKAVPPNTGQQPKNDVKKGHARTAVDPNFLSEFYNNSRLHHIATIGASFKHHISRLRESHNGKYPARDQLKAMIQRNQMNEAIDHTGKAIMHIDMDCFFVSVGLRSRPHLKGFPIGVTHSKGHNGNNLQNINGADRQKEMNLYIKRHEDKYKIDHSNDDENDRTKRMSHIDNTTSLSEIASCSYEARKMGVKNGMFVGAALKLCPDLKTIPYDFDAYKEVAIILYDTITQYTVDVEAVSCDEMYVNLTDTLRALDCSVDDFVSHVRNEIIEKTQCPCSAGIGGNKLQARMATKKAKPNGQFHLHGENVEEYFSEIPISDLPGVGFSTTQKCNNLGLKMCADLQQITFPKLQQEFGKKLGETLYQNCRGIDNKPLAYDQVRKSVSAEVNYGIRFKEDHELTSFLHQLCAEVQNRLNEISAKGKTITLKYMVRAEEAPVETAKFMGHGFCDNVTKSVTLTTYTSELSVITQTIFGIKNVLNVPPHELRGIGIQISKLNTTKTDGSRKNTLRNMFEKVQAKHIIGPTNPETDEQNAKGNSKTDGKSSLRKVKSFSGTPTLHRTGKSLSNNSNSKLHKIYEELDLSVLAELPHDIQDEILRDKNRLLNEANKNMHTNNLNTRGNKKFLARKLEDDFQDEDIKPPARSAPNCISEENILKSDDWRNILSHWLDNSGGDPVDCDVQIISNYFKEFARAQKLSEMMLFLKYLHRKTERMECSWHQIYHRIVQIVQHEVKIVFGSNVTLYVKPTFDCKRCLNKA